ncbi:MAG: hypothetical protein AAB400_02855 [Patescibacteria group bacterium]
MRKGKRHSIEQRKAELIRIATESTAYSHTSHRIDYNGMLMFSQAEVRLAMILDAMDAQYDTQVPFENCRDDDGTFTYVPDFVTRKPIKVVGCSHEITILETHGGEYLTHKDIRQMQAVRNLTGKRGHIFMRDHLNMLEAEGHQWYSEDFEDFIAPARDENVDHAMVELLAEVFRREGKTFHLNPFFRRCVEPTTGKTFTANGQFFFPQPQKLLGIEEPVQFLRIVKKLTKSTIIALESLRARNINAYALLKPQSLMYYREGTQKKRPQEPDGWTHFYTPNGEHSNLKGKQVYVNKPNGVKH